MQFQDDIQELVDKSFNSDKLVADLYARSHYGLVRLSYQLIMVVKELDALLERERRQYAETLSEWQEDNRDRSYG